MGFEPTVGFPTLDFESSALNRTQPPFLKRKENVEPDYAKSIGVASAGRLTSNSERRRHFEIGCSASSVRGLLSSIRRITSLRPAWRSAMSPNLTLRRNIFPQKNVTILCLPSLWLGLHVVCPLGQPRYYLLLTAVHRLLAPLFTCIRILFENLTPPHRHDSTKTRNPARFTHWTN